jgi:hypothetical protein
MFKQAGTTCYPVLLHTDLPSFVAKYVVRHIENETSPIAREPRVGRERQKHDYRTCSDLSQCYKA